jgi:hypothetical protein
VLHVRGVLLLDAATFLVSAALLGRLPSMPRSGAGPQARFLAATGAGLRYLWGERTLRAVTLGYFAVVACNGVDDVALVFLATDTLGTGDSAVGCCWAPSASGCWRGTRCWRGREGESRWLCCCWPALPSAAPATC